MTKYQQQKKKSNNINDTQRKLSMLKKITIIVSLSKIGVYDRNRQPNGY